METATIKDYPSHNKVPQNKVPPSLLARWEELDAQARKIAKAKKAVEDQIMIRLNPGLGFTYIGNIVIEKRYDSVVDSYELRDLCTANPIAQQWKGKVFIPNYIVNSWGYAMAPSYIRDLFDKVISKDYRKPVFGLFKKD